MVSYLRLLCTAVILTGACGDDGGALGPDANVATTDAGLEPDGRATADAGPTADAADVPPDATAPPDAAPPDATPPDAHVDQPPIAENLAVTTDEDEPVAFALLGSDPDGDPLGFTVTTQPAQGSLSGAAPNLTYTPAANASGTVSFEYIVTAGAMDSAPATVTITIAAVNDPPVAVPLSVSTLANQPANVQLAASDVDGDLLGFEITLPPSSGSLSGQAPALTYTPAPGFVGTDSFTYRANDGAAFSAEALVAITVGANGSPPVANADGYDAIGNTSLSVAASQGLLANDSDPDGTPLTVDSADSTSQLGGQVSVAPDGSFSYLPPVGQTAVTDSFSYVAIDGDGSLATGSVTIAIGEMVWYVDNTSASGDGRSTSPLPTLAAAAAAAGPGDTLYVARGNGTSSGLTQTITVLDDQRLLGEGVALTIAGRTLRPAGQPPVLSATSGAAVRVARDAYLAGFRIDGAAQSAITINPATTDSLSVVIEDVEIVAPGAHGIQSVMLGPLDLTVRDVRIEDAGDAAIYILNVPSIPGTSRVAIRDSVMLGPAGVTATPTGIDIEYRTSVDATLDLTIVGNRIERVDDGVRLLTQLAAGAGAAGPVRARIRDNQIHGFEGAGIQATIRDTSVVRFGFDGNSIDGQAGTLDNNAPEDGVWLRAGGTADVRGTIDDNVIAGVLRDGIGTQIIGQDTSPVIVLTASGNAIEASGRGIELDASSAASVDATLTSNTVTGVEPGSQNAGIRLLCLAGQTRLHLADNDAPLRYWLIASAPCGLAGPGQGTFQDDDGGNLAATGNTSAGGAPIVDVVGDITGIAPGDVAVPMPLP